MIDTVLSRPDTRYLRDLAMIVLARVHGLRAASVQSITGQDFNLKPSGWAVVVSALKGHTREQARRYGADLSHREPPSAKYLVLTSCHAGLKEGRVGGFSSSGLDAVLTHPYNVF